jgi:hypothetical protein
MFKHLVCIKFDQNFTSSVNEVGLDLRLDTPRQKPRMFRLFFFIFLF